MKLHKATIYFFDVNECSDETKELLNYALDSEDISFDLYDHEKVDVEWNDNIDLNRYECNKETYEKYFKNTEPK